MLPADIHNEIVSQLRRDSSIKSALLFGSYARGTPDEGSDVDIVIIIDRKGVHRSYDEIQQDRNRINALLIQTRKKIPMDIVVYTNDEWSRVREDPSDFVRNIEREAISLI